MPEIKVKEYAILKHRLRILEGVEKAGAGAADEFVLTEKMVDLCAGNFGLGEVREDVLAAARKRAGERTSKYNVDMHFQHQ